MTGGGVGAVVTEEEGVVTGRAVDVVMGVVAVEVTTVVADVVAKDTADEVVCDAICKCDVLSVDVRTGGLPCVQAASVVSNRDTIAIAFAYFMATKALTSLENHSAAFFS